MGLDLQETGAEDVIDDFSYKQLANDCLAID